MREAHRGLYPKFLTDNYPEEIMAIILFLVGLSLGTLLGMMIISMLITSRRTEAEDESLREIDYPAAIPDGARLQSHRESNPACG